MFVMNAFSNIKYDQLDNQKLSFNSIILYHVVYRYYYLPVRCIRYQCCGTFDNRCV